MFGFRKKETVKGQQQKGVTRPLSKQREQQKGQKRKRHWFLKSCFILIMLGILGYGLYAYVENVKENAYVQGSNDAIAQVTQAVKDNGGVKIDYNGEVITMSAYYKPIGEDIVTEPVIANSSTTNETNESAT